MDRQKLHIGTYFLRPYACTEKHVRDLAECGIDMVFCMQNDPAVLDLFEQYGVGAFVNGVVPGWFGGNGDCAGTMQERNPISAYEKVFVGFTDHPAIWGIDIGDEPSALDFPHYGKVFDTVQQLWPEKTPYINIYPGYGMLASNTKEQTDKELGTADYAAYIDAYCRHVTADYLSFDHYMFSSDAERLISDLQVTANACKQHGKSLWIVLQVNSHDPEKWISLEQLRYQAYTAMCFGVECITWACYTAGWWYHQVLDDAGEKTEQYEKLKTVNAEIRAMADVYMQYRFDKAEVLRGADIEKWGALYEICTDNGSPLTLGKLCDRQNEEQKALFFCIGDALKETSNAHTLRFKAESGRKVLLYSGDGRAEVHPDLDGWYRLQVQNCSGGLITAE